MRLLFDPLILQLLDRPVSEERLNVLFVGRIQARKRIDNLLLACSALPDDIQPGLLHRWGRP